MHEGTHSLCLFINYILSHRKVVQQFTRQPASIPYKFHPSVTKFLTTSSVPTTIKALKKTQSTLFPHYNPHSFEVFAGDITAALMDMVRGLVAQSPVVIFSRSTCCISHSIKTLFRDFGSNPAIYELDEISGSWEIEQALARLGCNPVVPAVFIGGELVGGAKEVMSLHLNRSLKPMLKKAGALWV